MLVIPALSLLAHPSPRSRSLLLAWNLFGTLDLVAAIVLGLVSTQGSPLQILEVGVGSAAMQVLPWSFVPTVLVPLYLIMHGILFVRLRQAGPADTRAV